MTFEVSRKKQVLVLQPRGKALYEDDSSFGSKMLAKMGWSKGNGLGKQQHGNLDFIQIRYKNNANGLGYEALKDNQWTDNESQFDSLLQALNGNPGSGDETAKSEKKSLEEKSKSSRARVHYKKFTRGKDVHKYSEKELANILGKKTLSEVKAKPAEVPEVPEVEDDKPDVYDSNLIVNAGLSVTDYFKQKMQAKKQSTAKSSEEKPKKRKALDESQEEESVEIELTKSAKKKRRALDKIETVEPELIQEDLEEAPKKKKKKKSKKSSDEEAPVEQPEQVAEPSVSSLPAAKPASKKPSKRSDPERPTGANAVYSTNVIQIPSHVAQKLSCMTVDKFNNANVANIVGYGLSEDVELKIVQTKMGDNFLNTDKYSLYNIDRLTTSQRVNPRKILSKIKKTKKSIQVI